MACLRLYAKARLPACEASGQPARAGRKNIARRTVTGGAEGAAPPGPCGPLAPARTAAARATRRGVGGALYLPEPGVQPPHPVPGRLRPARPPPPKSSAHPASGRGVGSGGPAWGPGASRGRRVETFLCVGGTQHNEMAATAKFSSPPLFPAAHPGPRSCPPPLAGRPRARAGGVGSPDRSSGRDSDPSCAGTRRAARPRLAPPRSGHTMRLGDSAMRRSGTRHHDQPRGHRDLP